MRMRRRRSPLRFLQWLIPVGVIALTIVNWQAITDWLANGGLAPDVAAAPTRPPAIGSIASPIVTEEMGADGFPIKARKYVSKYTVQPGDALLVLAERFNISPNTILWANTETLKDNVDLILVGTELYILPIDGIYHRADGVQTVAQIAALYGVDPSVIVQSEYNQMSQMIEASVPPKGLRIVVPGGSRAYLTWQSPFLTGTGSGQANPQGVSHPGSCRERYAGAGGTGSYENPVRDPYRVTTGFEPWHPGVDLAADPGTSIYASDTGIIVFSGWHRVGYGELLIIDHGGGWTTYYGHLSKRFVGCGDQVEKGQLIALMGATGNASGIHLHFEIRQNDAPLNPYNFITISDVRDATPQP